MGLNEDALRANRDSLLRASSADVFEGNGYSLCRIVARIFPILNASLCLFEQFYDIVIQMHHTGA